MGAVKGFVRNIWKCRLCPRRTMRRVSGRAQGERCETTGSSRQRLAQAWCAGGGASRHEVCYGRGRNGIGRLVKSL